MQPYQKIHNVFNRDNDTKKLIYGAWSKSEFKLLKDIDWLFTEKIDGTNVRIMYSNGNIVFADRQGKGVLPTPLLAYLHELKPELLPKMTEIFGDKEVCLYGEGFGKGIQEVGKYYSDTQQFILFDVKVNGKWLSREKVFDIALKLKLRIVPLVAVGGLEKGIKLVSDGLHSELIDDNTIFAEGLVAKPACELFDDNGNRIVTKIKHRDFYGIQHIK